MEKKVMEEIAMFIGEVIENGYNTEKSLNHLKSEYKLNDIQLSNMEELITNFQYEIEDNLDEDYDWDNFMDLVIEAVNKRM